MAITNLKELNIDQLKAAAQEFAVDLKTGANKASIIKEFEDMGVTAQMYNALFVEPEEPTLETELDESQIDQRAPVEAPVEDDNPIVIKMTRKNGTYEIRGYRFTRQNPYALVGEEDAEYLIETGGFRQASPKELREYYAQ